MDINAAVTAIEQFLRDYPGVAATQVRPSGDDVDVIKVWVDLAGDDTDLAAWKSACTAAIRKAVPAASAFRLELHVEP